MWQFRCGCCSRWNGEVFSSMKKTTTTQTVLYKSSSLYCYGMPPVEGRPNKIQSLRSVCLNMATLLQYRHQIFSVAPTYVVMAARGRGSRQNNSLVNILSRHCPRQLYQARAYRTYLTTPLMLFQPREINNVGAIGNNVNKRPETEMWAVGCEQSNKRFEQERNAFTEQSLTIHTCNVTLVWLVQPSL